MLKLMNWLFDSSTNWWGFASQYLPLPPLVLRIRITNRCNLSCHYCYVGQSLNKKTEALLNYEEWKEILNKTPRYTLIDITGGEPLLAPQIADLLRIMLDRKMKVSLITNGTVHKDEIFSLMVEKKLTHLMFSLDGREEVNDSVRGKGSFRKTISAAKRIKELKIQYQSRFPKLVAKVTLTKDSISDVESFCHYLFEEGFDGVTLNLLFQNLARDGFVDAESISDDKFFQGNKVEFASEDIPFFVDKIKKVKSAFGNKVQIRPDIDLNDLESYFSRPQSLMPHNCLKFNSVVTLYHNGTLAPCDLGLNIGNIRDINFDISKIFSEKKMKSFTNFMKKTPSQKLPGCGGCCLKKHERVS
ncbi:MAG TPA: radical SAM protein [Bacteriovoracaceae bacterium]|nr:radical SAM protein [Bacteriovoracaceae bacterium]